MIGHGYRGVAVHVWTGHTRVIGNGCIIKYWDSLCHRSYRETKPRVNPNKLRANPCGYCLRIAAKIAKDAEKLKGKTG